MADNLPRLLLAGANSGAGKTTMTCALLQALLNRGMHPAAFKCGPDYIDPMFHTRVIGAESRNLDLYLCNEETVRHLFQTHAKGKDVAIIEGVMGFYDGVGDTTQASSYHLARVTQTPVVLVVNARGMSLSAAALVKGFASLRADSGIAAVLLNQCSHTLYPRLRTMIERETGLPVLGYLPPMPDCTLESRHLGLVTAAEVSGLQEKLAKLADQAAQTLDLDSLLQLSITAPPLPDSTLQWPKAGEPVRVAYALDRAFCFYYEDALDLLRRLGAELVPFSPLADHALPKQVDGLLLGGGYPELYAKELAANQSLREEIGARVQAGLPCIAECGGFMYLHRTMQAADKTEYPMAGALDARCWDAGRLCRFGYTELEAQQAGILCPAGERLHAHEFHRWDSDACGAAFTAQKPSGGQPWQCGHHTPSMYAGFPHVHLCGHPAVAARFLTRCRARHERRNHQWI